MSQPNVEHAAPYQGAAPQGPGAEVRTHSHPFFDGTRSRWHIRTATWKSRLRAQAERLRRRRALGNIETLVQFVGFPRSGHSLIGALLDAHDEAIIAHELDAMGLFRKGLPVKHLPGLMAWNSEAFSRHGRWWNGLCYKVPHTRDIADKVPRVIGDKKGDWAARWAAENPALVDRFRAESPFACKWILVTRHPLDNVATMSLRQGKVYDRLRIEAASGAEFRDAVATAQENGTITTEASDDLIAEYRALCAAVAMMKSRIPPEDWFEIAYEDFVSAPRDALTSLAAFVGLEAPSDWLEQASSLVHASSRLSRDSITWDERQRAAVARTVSDFDFLQGYE